MLSMARPAISSALCGRKCAGSLTFLSLIDPTARSRVALCLPRAQPIAALSTSTLKSATALERQSTTGQPLSASGKVRSEVALPSQEKKEGAMQYVLFVPLQARPPPALALLTP